jgi:hypothetical protein
MLGCGSGKSGYDTNNSSSADNGAPAQPAPVPPPTGTDATISTDTVRTRSLAVCLNCHNGVTEPPDLRTAQAVKNNATDIQFHVNNNLMPPPNSGFPLLDACQRELLNKWIELGTPDVSTVKVTTLTNCPNGLIDFDGKVEGP